MEKLGHIISKTLAMVVLPLLFSGCASIVSVLDKLEGDAPSEEKDTAAESAIAAVYWDGPRVRPGIVLIIQVGAFSGKPTSMQAQVDEKGEITLPYLLQKSVACNGLTLEDLKEKLVEAYEEYIKQPQVTVTFAPFDGRGVSPWGTVTVLGEVAVPGPVNMPSTRDLTVTKVLQAAGGLRPFANKTQIRVTRCDKDGNQTKTIVNLNEIGEKGRIDKDIPLKAGDVVWVPETWY